MKFSFEDIVKQLPGLVAIKTSTSEFVYVNDNLARLVGFDRGHDLHALNDNDLRCDAVSHARKFREQDIYVLEYGSLNSIDIVRYADDSLHLILSQKKQFRVGGEIGIIYHGTDISGDFQASLCQQLANINSDYMFKSTKKQQSLSIDTERAKDISLTIRQFEVLYLTLRGHSTKEIGAQLNLSGKTIESHIERIKSVANCQTRSEMIEWALSQGLFVLLPGFNGLMPW